MASSDRMPDFLIIGAGKSGTKSLWAYLGQHPDMYMSPVKEPGFFAYDGAPASVPHHARRWIVTDIDEYRGLFRDAADEQVTGEASGFYLFNLRAPERIKHYIPTVRMIALLRNPIDRAYSGWLQWRRLGHEHEASFWEAIQPQLRGQDRAPHVPERPQYLNYGLYAEQLERYLRLFDSPQIRVYLHDDFASAPLAVLADAFRFLGVDDSFVPDVSVRYNVRHDLRSRLLDRLLSRPPSRLRSFVHFVLRTPRRRIKTSEMLRRLNKAPAPPLPEATRQMLIPFFDQDVRRLSLMLGRDLSHWLGEAPVNPRDVPKYPGVHPALAERAI